MRSIVLSLFVALVLTLHANAYLGVEDGAFNVRHFHMIKRDKNGEIVGRAFGNEYEVVLEARKNKCTTILACGTPGGCATMAGQRYCKGEAWNKSFQKAIKQTGANGAAGLKMMAEGIGRGPVGMIAGMAKSTAKALIKAKKEKKGRGKKKEGKGKKHKKRSLDDDEILLGRSDVYEFVERDGDMSLVQRGSFIMSESIMNENGHIVTKKCEGINGKVTCV